MQSLASQFYAFVVTIVMGFTMGALFDVYKVSKGIIRPGKVAGYAGDMLFWLISTLTVFLLLLIGNWGEIRMYVVIGVVIGVVVYCRFLSGLVIWVLLRFFFVLKKFFAYLAVVCSYIWFVLTYPVSMIRKTIIIPIGYLGTACSKSRRAAQSMVNRAVVNPLAGGARTAWSNIKRRLKFLTKK